MRRRRWARSAPLLVAALLFLFPAGAAAFYGDGAQIVSADFVRQEEGDDGTDFSAISADGRYVAIQTTARNFFGDDDPDPAGMYRAGGIFRFDLTTKALEKVADGSLFDEATNAFKRRGAASPSISADGRYVAFATAQPLVAADTNDNIDVYVRDMDVPIGEPGAFDLVSARDGGDEPAQYGGPGTFPGNNPGADVTRGLAISADGMRVAFVTTAPSDLPASADADVPAGQVFVRDRATNTTTLVSVARDPLTGAMTDQPAGGALGAGISADGTTVAWTGSNAPAQVRLLGGENDDPALAYYLWRRVADGPAALTRRITGLSDPDDPGCPSDSFNLFDQTTKGPCFGPLTDQESLRAGITNQVPSLSADGDTVAFLTGAGPRPLSATGPGLDLFVTDMSPGVSRKSGTVELTRDTPGDPTTSPPINGIAMSPDGRYVALVSARTKFTLPALQFQGSPRTVPGTRELYVADLQQKTIERVTHSTSGGDIDGDVLNGVTISGNGDRVAFASFAGNLFYGDANGRSDAFVATRQPEPGGGPTGEGGGGGGPGGTVEFDSGGPQIGVRAASKRGGVVVLAVSVPAAGGVRAVAKGQAGDPRKLRTLATADARARGSSRSTVTLKLKPVDRYLGELRREGAISARAAVTYVASQGGRRAGATVHIAFRETLAKAAGRAKK